MEQASTQGFAQSANTVHIKPTRSGHSPELPLDPIDLGIGFTAAANTADFLDEVMAEEDEQLRSAKVRGYQIGFAEGKRDLRSWCAASMIGGALLLFLFAGAFPEWASLVIRQQPAPLVPAALASLNATSR